MVISFHDFQKMELKVGTIESVEDHPNADKLYLMKINLGSEVKQSCAGLKPYFSRDELMGKKVVVVANLEPAKMRGELSECMVLAADNDNEISLVNPGDVPDGCKVR